MKKKFGKLFIIFGALICIFALVGCDLIFEESRNNEPEKPIVPAEELIDQIIEYLIHVSIDHDMPSVSIADKINRIKGGQQLLHIGFDSQSEYYFVCAYFNTSHNELFKCCCSEEYTWVGFKNADEIPEYYNGEKFLVAFQINKASFVEGVVTNEKPIPNMEHFKHYFPIFEEGFNISPPIVFEDEFIYLNPSDGSTVYYSTDVHYHILVTMRCIHLDGKDYIAKILYYSAQSFDEERVNEKLEYELGEYYDLLIDMMIIHDDGENPIYGLFEIDEFVNKVFK